MAFKMEHISNQTLQSSSKGKDVGFPRGKIGFILLFLRSCRRFFVVYVLQWRMTIPFWPLTHINKMPKEVIRLIFDRCLLICLTPPNRLSLNLVHKKSIWILMKNDFELSGVYYCPLLSLVNAVDRKTSSRCNFSSIILAKS